MSILCNQWHVGRPSPTGDVGVKKRKRKKEVRKKSKKMKKGEKKNESECKEEQSNRGMMKNGEKVKQENEKFSLGKGLGENRNGICCKLGNE